MTTSSTRERSQQRLDKLLATEFLDRYQERSLCQRSDRETSIHRCLDLLQRGASMDGFVARCGPAHQDLMRVVLLRGDADLLEAFIVAGVDVRTRDPATGDPDPILIAAAASHQTACIAALLRHGADPQAANIFGERGEPLRQCQVFSYAPAQKRRQQVDAFLALVEAGADLSTSDPTGHYHSLWSSVTVVVDAVAAGAGTAATRIALGATLAAVLCSEHRRREEAAGWLARCGA